MHMTTLGPNSRETLAIALVLSFSANACSRRDSAAVGTARPTLSAPSAATARAQSTARAPQASSVAAAVETAPEVASAPVHATPPPARAAATSVVDHDEFAPLRGVVAGELSDVGPAGPATATAEGVVLVTKDDRVLVAARTAAAHPEKARFATLDVPPSALAPLGHGPGVARGKAYWISQGRLVRRGLLPEQPLEVLVDGARDGTRVTAVDVAGTTAVAFIGRPDAERTSHARLWVERGPVLDLTPEGAGASSVALARVGERLLATCIDGRSAMTPMHARYVTLGPHAPALEPDVVVWVGGPAQRWTETFLGADGERAFAHVPIERDVTHFGLATIDLGSEPHMESDVAFFDYQNGLDLAPVAAGALCRHDHVAYVRPTTSTPHSPAELVLARVGTREAMMVTSARGFASVSLAPVDGGGVLAYVADGRTWALGLGCR